MGMFDRVEVDPALAAETNLPNGSGWQTKSHFPRGGNSLGVVRLLPDRTMEWSSRHNDGAEVILGNGVVTFYTPYLCEDQKDVRPGTSWLEYDAHFVDGVLYRLDEVQRGVTPHESPVTVWEDEAKRRVVIPVSDVLAVLAMLERLEQSEALCERLRHRIAHKAP